jgi:protein TonB
VLRFGSDKPIPDNFASFLVEGIRTNLVLPTPLALGVYGSHFNRPIPPGSKQPEELVPAFSSEFIVALRQDGSVRDLRLLQESLAPALDAAIARAIYLADSTKSLPPIGEVTDKSEIVVFIDIDMVDSATSGRYPLFRVTVPVYPMTRAVSQLRTPDAVPHYPDELRNQGIAGFAQLRFVVDESGKVAEHSYRIVKLSEIPFGQAVLAVMPRFRFEPARIGNCPVKSIVEQSFEFKVDRR